MIDDTIETETAGDSTLDDTVVYEEPPAPTTDGDDSARAVFSLLKEAQAHLEDVRETTIVSEHYVAKAKACVEKAINYLNLGD